jgi:hypothetical protein
MYAPLGLRTPCIFVTGRRVLDIMAILFEILQMRKNYFINIIGFRASIAVDIAIIKQKIRFLLMLGTSWQHVPKPAYL